MSDLLFSDPVRLHQVGAGVSRTLEPDAAARKRIAASLDLAALDSFTAEMDLKPTDAGWRLKGRVRAQAVQTCGLTLEPLPVEIDRTFVIRLAEAVDEDSDEIVIDMDDDDAPDLIEEGRIDLGQYAVEQLLLSLDPFPRKPGAEFVQPEEPHEISPFAVLKAFPTKDSSGQG